MSDMKIKVILEEANVNKDFFTSNRKENNLKCPFCQQKMRRTNGTHNKVGVWQCQNSNDPTNVCIASGYLFNDDVLNYINRTRKAFDVAVDALKDIRCIYTGDQTTKPSTMFGRAAGALNEITALEQEQ